MKIGITSDIHGDLTSLKKAIDLFLEKNVDKILCAGDILGKELFSSEVIKTMQNFFISSVKGNHDEILAKAIKWKYSCQKINPLYSYYIEKYLNLEKDEEDFLKDLPYNLYYVWNGIRIYVVHDFFYIDRTTSTSCNKKILKTDSDVLIVGHTHQPDKKIIKNILILNPGSVCGNSYRDSNTCAILELPSLKFDIYELK